MINTRKETVSRFSCNKKILTEKIDNLRTIIFKDRFAISLNDTAIFDIFLDDNTLQPSTLKLCDTAIPEFDHDYKVDNHYIIEISELPPHLKNII